MTPGDRRALAVALAYSPGDSAPVVVASGRGLVAEKIIEMASQSGIFVRSSPELVALLSKLQLDESVPPELWIAVAEILAWVERSRSGLPSES